MVNVNKINKFEVGKALTPENIYKLKFKEELEKAYEKLYFDNFNYIIITNMFFFSVILSLIIYIISYPQIYIYFNSYITASFFHNIFTTFLIWFVLNLTVYYSLIIGYFVYLDSKFKKIEDQIEKDLPEFIDNLVSNLKGGISLEKALLKSVRLEQKDLLKEVTLINEKIMMGMNSLDALREFRERFNSQIIGRTLFLVEEGLKGGGNLAAPLERISENLKKIYALNEEIKSSASGFSIVIRAITLIVAPLLFALAITLLTFIRDLFSLLSRAGDAVSFVSEIPAEFSTYLVYFSYAMIFLITLFSSLITSQLNNEKLYVALKYLPVYIIISLFLYWQFSSLLLGFFGNIIS